MTRAAVAAAALFCCALCGTARAQNTEPAPPADPGAADTGGEAARAFPRRAHEDEDALSTCSALVSPWSDPLSGCQWNLRNRGQRGGTPGEDIRVEEVWAAGNLGAGIGVAVVDYSIDGSHPDLRANVDAGRSHDYVADDPDLDRGGQSHGTSVAGVIAMRDNALGGRGVAPRATIYGYNYLSDGLTFADLADAMTRNMASTAVSNNSWGSGDPLSLRQAPLVWEKAVDRGLANGYGGKGVVYVFPAGNGGVVGNANFSGLNNYYGVVAVCAVDDRGRRVDISEEGANLWLCAPSKGSGRSGILTIMDGGLYRTDFSGTSAAVPAVSGVVALIRAANRSLTWRDVKLILAGSARKNDASNGGWRTGAAKYDASGNYEFNHEYGFGVVDAKAAVKLAGGWKLLPRFIQTDPAKAAPDLAVPDGTSSGPGTAATSTVIVGREVEFIEFVEIVADFEMSQFRDLEVELVSPSGAVSTLAHPRAGKTSPGETGGIPPPNFRFGSAAHLGEDPAGVWTLRVTDHNEGDTATLKSWSVKIHGHRSTLVPGAPAAAAAAPGRRVLSVSWSPPPWAGDPPLTSYDLRFIESSAVDRSDPEWTVAPRVWTGGPLEYALTGLRDGTRYDVQVRGVNARGRGAWSASATAETLPNRPPEAVGSVTAPDLRMGGGDVSLDLSRAFRDPDGDAVTLQAWSRTNSVLAWAVGGRVVLSPAAPEDATVEVTATDVTDSSAQASHVFDVIVRRRRGVTVSTGALTVAEGSTNTYTVSLNSAPSGDVTVTPVVPANGNLSVTPARLGFSASDWYAGKTVTVAAATDANTVSEAAATIGHTVSGADYASVAAPPVRVTTVENDAAALSVEAAGALEEAGPVSFEVTLSRASASEVLVDYATSDGTARAGSDYAAASGTLAFPAGSTASQRIVVAVADDAEDEDEEETFRLTLRNPRHASLAGGGSTLRVTGTIQDDDDPEVAVSFGSSSYGVTEGGTTSVVVRLDRDPERELKIVLERTHHGGTEDGDYSGVREQVWFVAGVRSRQFQVAATDDAFDDDGESVALSFGPLPSRVTGAAGTTIAIADNDGGGGPGPGPGGGGGGGGGGGSPPGDDDDGDDGGGSGGGSPGGGGPPRAAIETDAACEGTFCRALTGVPVSFRDASAGAARSRLWEFGDGRRSRSASLSHAWSSPGFYEAALSVSDGTVESTASLTFLVEAADPAGTCAADEATRCLGDSRYAVSVEWRTADGASGPARVVRSGTNESGLFSFFDAANWEALVKVVDGCAVNGRHWVFAASTTDLGFTIRVVDTATGAAREYRNESGMPAPAITDATAFAEGCGP